MAQTDKLDLVKEHKDQYAAPKKPTLVTVRKAKYLAISGQGAPGGDRFQACIGALFGVAYTIKMARKAEGVDYKVCPLEGLYQTEDGSGDFCKADPETWCWTLMIRVPGFVTKRDLDKAVAQLLEKDKGREVKEVTLDTLAEGRCVQQLHVGPYDKEPETVAQMARFAEGQGLAFHGRHHEIYLSDPRRVPPERLRTILRMPVRRGTP